MSSYIIYAIALGLPLLFLVRRRALSQPPPRPAVTTTQTDEKNSLKTIMQAPRGDLDPPKDDPFTLSALAEFDGSNDTKPIYVSIKGNAKLVLYVLAPRYRTHVLTTCPLQVMYLTSPENATCMGKAARIIFLRARMVPGVSENRV